MRLALKSLEPRQPLVPQPVLGKHASDRFAQDLAAPVLLHQAVHGERLERAGPRVVPVVCLLPHLSARDVQSRAVRHDDVVAAVG